MRIDRDLPTADDSEAAAIVAQLEAFWNEGLLPHFRAECECLLARLVRHVVPEDELIARTQRDHLRIESLMLDLRDSTDWAVRRRATMEIGTTLKEHIRWEEAVLFEAVQSSLADGEKNALQRDLEDRIPEIPAEPIWPKDSRPTAQ
jgi:hemerythrin-like domain-containing protein